MNQKTLRAGAATALAIGLAVSVTACSTSNNGASGDAEQTTLTLLTDNAETQIKVSEALISAFEAANPDIQIKYESRPGGSEGDNIVKTRLATDEMADLFTYNSGSLFQQINPTQFMEPLDGQPFLDNVSDAFFPVVTAQDSIYGVPFAGSSAAGGIFYHIPTYVELGLEVPKTWDEFMSNNEMIKAAGKDAVIQTYGETSTSQLVTLSDFHNVAQADSQWAEKYTNNQAKFATDPVALASFSKLEELAAGEFFNRDFASLKFDQGVLRVVSGEGVHIPVLSGAMNAVPADKINDVGFFPIPGDDPSTNGMTTWMSDGLYINKNAENKEAALKFVEFVTTAESCNIRATAAGVTGPWQLTDCSLPSDANPIVKAMDTFAQSGAETPALEYLSPIKGPNLEHLLVEVGSGLASAEDAAARYDEDVKKQAQQLGLEGW